MSASLYFPSSVVENIPPETLKTIDSWLSLGDSRVGNWFLMNPFHMAVVTLSYLLTISFLVAFTKTLKLKFDLKGAMLLHNFNLFALSAYMMIECIRQAVLNNYSLWGNGVDSTDKGLGMAQILWIFYLSKILEFGDTCFMALRGNYRQITFLHVYHHASIFFIWWIVVYYGPGGDSYFSAALNSFIHVLMYGYYFWAALQSKKTSTGATESEVKRKPTWREPEFYKQFITSGQMLQFTIMLAQASYNLYFEVPNFPRFLSVILFYYMFTMLALFGNFYILSYIAPKKSTDKPESSKSK